MKFQFNGYFYKNEKNAFEDVRKVFLKKFSISENFLLHIHSVSNHYSKELNEHYFQKDYPTDVLTIPLYKDLASINKLDKNNKPYEVGKSHHAGHNQFSLDHGTITPKLANMFIKLCQRYGTRSNWRGYTYNDEMQGQALLQLSQIGLQFDESKSQNPFAYYTATITNSFTRVLNSEKKNQNLRDDLLEQAGAMPSLTRQMKNSEELATIEQKQKEEK